MASRQRVGEAYDRGPMSSPTPPLTPADYLKKILTARVYDVAVESALEPARALSARLGNTVLRRRTLRAFAGSSADSTATS